MHPDARSILDDAHHLARTSLNGFMLDSALFVARLQGVHEELRKAAAAEGCSDAEFIERAVYERIHSNGCVRTHTDLPI
jgi:uncharacterized protein (DUF1778 family)